MQYFFLIMLLAGLASCHEEDHTMLARSSEQESRKDTIIVRSQKTLSGPNEVGFYSRYYYYNWSVGNDRLPFTIHVAEYERDSMISLQVFHERSILFSTALERIAESIETVREDFDLSKLKYIFFKAPSHYLDLTKELSKEYEQKFGWKDVSYDKLDKFLLASSVTTKLNEFLKPLGLKVKRYDIEKARIMSREGVGLQLDLPGVDFSGYPDHMIHGMGFSVHVTSITK